MNRLRACAWLIGALLCLGMSVGQAASIVISNGDNLGEGLKDMTRVQPVGGNDGTTRGQQRMNALQYAANMLGSRLQSNVPIKVYAKFDPPSKNGLSCSSTGATLAATGAAFLVAFDPTTTPAGAKSSVYYPIALANALAGYDMNNGKQSIYATFNSGPDTDPGCLAGKDWYYGLDNKGPANTLNFVSTAVHELLHGLGFTTYAKLDQSDGLCILGLLCLGDTDDGCGEFYRPAGYPASDQHPDIFSFFVLDLAGGQVGAGTTWPHMSPQQRCDSQSDTGFLVWSGPNVTSAAPSVFSSGLRQGYLQLYAPPEVTIGSSVSHWATSLTPDALMEPFDEGDIAVPEDIGIATCFLMDIGWHLSPGTSCPDSGRRGDTLSTQPPPLNAGPGAHSGGGGGGSFGWPLLLLGCLLLGCRKRLMRRRR